MKKTFSIRQLLVLFVIVAVCSLMIRTDWVAAVGFAVASMLFTFAVRPTANLISLRLNRWLRLLAILGAAVIGWFSVVDKSEFNELCMRCGIYRSVEELRIGGIPIWESQGKFHINNLHRFQKDFGFACDHQFERTHNVRAWGLIYRMRPNLNATCGLSGDNYYDDEFSQAVRHFASENPKEAADLHQRIVVDQDFTVMDAFVERIKAALSKR